MQFRYKFSFMPLQSLRNLSSSKFKIVFVGGHGLCHFQIALWLVLWWKPVRVMVILSKMFFAGNQFPSFFTQAWICYISLTLLLSSILLVSPLLQIYNCRCFIVRCPWIFTLRWKVNLLRSEYILHLTLPQFLSLEVKSF